MKKEICEFYKKTSPFTELGLYRDFARNLPDDINACIACTDKEDEHTANPKPVKNINL